MPNPIKWLIALIKGWLAARAEIAEKQQEHVGKIVQSNEDLKQQVEVENAQIKTLAGAKPSDTVGSLSHGDF